MLLKRYGEYILRGRKEAALNAFIWSLVPLLTYPLVGWVNITGWISAVIVCLVTLRSGAFAGIFVLIWALVPTVVSALIGYPPIPHWSELIGIVVGWLLSVVLRETQSWSRVVQVSILLAIIAVALAHLFFPDINLYWYKLLKEFYKDSEQQLALGSQIPADAFFQTMAKMVTGTQAVVLLFIALFNVLIARWWQALLFNPGGLAPELYDVRLNVIAIIGLILTIMAAIWQIDIAWDFLPILLAGFFIAGLSLVHALIKYSRSMWIFLIGYYLLLVFLFKYIGVFTVLFAVIDVFVDFRARFKDYMKSKPSA